MVMEIPFFLKQLHLNATLHGTSKQIYTESLLNVLHPLDKGHKLDAYKMFKRRLWRSVIFSFTKSNTPPWMSFECFM